jgi:uncharacterized protein YkwD
MSAAARFRYTLVAGATAVVIGAGFTVTGLARHSSESALSSSSTDLPLVAPEPPIFPDDEPGLLPSSSPATRSSSAPAPTATTKPAAKPRTGKPATSRPTPRPPAAPQASGSILGQVLAHINAARDDEGLDALRLDGNLSRAAALHNQRMIDGCGLNHRCSGEGGIGDRFSAQGVQWRSAGENIGFGSSGASNAAIVGAANRLTDSMLAETPPDDGHRRNLLSRDFERIGLSVVRDDGRVWLTQDFVG